MGHEHRLRHMIILFCGIPAAGKTTIATKLARKLERIGTVKLLSSDALRTPVYRKLSNLLLEHQDAFDFLILDATFYREQHREKIQSLARGRVVTVFCDVPLETAMARNDRRDTTIPVVGIRSIAGQMEKPVDPDIYVKTDMTSADDAALMIFQYVSELLVDERTGKP